MKTEHPDGKADFYIYMIDPSVLRPRRGREEEGKKEGEGREGDRVGIWVEQEAHDTHPFVILCVKKMG